MIDLVQEILEARGAADLFGDRNVDGLPGLVFSSQWRYAGAQNDPTGVMAEVRRGCLKQA